MPKDDSHYHIISDPLVGLDAIAPRSRIVVWDHYLKAPVFVGVVRRLVETADGIKAVGENFVRTDDDNRLSRPSGIDPVKHGLLPLPGTTDQYSQRYRTYLLPEQASPSSYKKLKVAYKIPERHPAIPTGFDVGTVTHVTFMEI